MMQPRATRLRSASKQPAPVPRTRTPKAKAVLAVVGLLGLGACAQLNLPGMRPKHPKHAATAWEQVSPEAGTFVVEPSVCALPKFKDDYAGFTIGQPSGWGIDYSTGSITVTKDESGLVGAIVVPARVRKKDFRAEELADAFAEGLGKTLEDRGGSLDLTDKVTDGHVAQAMASATVDGVKLKGPLRVVADPGFATLKLYWAPESSFDDEEPTLKQVVACFQREMVVTAKRPVEPPGGRVTKVPPAGAKGSPKEGAPAAPAEPKASVPLKAFQSRYFVGSMPEGWTIKGETANGIDLASADGSQAVGFGWVMSPVMTPAQVVQQDLARYHPGARVIASGAVPTQPGWTAVALEFADEKTHGYEQAAASSSVELTTMVLASPKAWDASKETLAAIARSIQITPGAVSTVNQQVRAQLATLPRATPPTSSIASSSSSSFIQSWEERQASQDKINQGWGDAILGQDRAVSPSTGEEYVVPQSAWNANGPSGAGYYRATDSGDVERLQVQGE